MTEQLDDLLARIPKVWDFSIGTDWNSDDGSNEFFACLMRRALGDYEHLGHHLCEIETDGLSLRDALEKALVKAVAWEAEHTARGGDGQLPSKEN